MLVCVEILENLPHFFLGGGRGEKRFSSFWVGPNLPVNELNFKFPRKLFSRCILSLLLTKSLNSALPGAQIAFLRNYYIPTDQPTN